MKYLPDYDAVGATMIKGIGVIHQTFLRQGQLGGLTGRAIMGLMPPAGKGDGKAAGVRRDRRPRRPETPEVGEGRFRVAARATDGLIEAFEGVTNGFCLDVQWHPEYRLTRPDRTIMAAFVRQCARHANAEIPSLAPQR